MERLCWGYGRLLRYAALAFMLGVLCPLGWVALVPVRWWEAFCDGFRSESDLLLVRDDDVNEGV